MTAVFDKLIERVLDSEGGYTAGLPGDPGGETNFGISKRSYPNEDIKVLTRAQAIEIYRRDFWVPVQGDYLPPMVAELALDFAINAGVQTSIAKLQLALGVADDGHWGPVTQAAALKANPLGLVLRLVAEQLDFRRKLKNFTQFASGWDARMANNLRFIAGMVAP